MSSGPRLPNSRTHTALFTHTRARCDAHVAKLLQENAHWLIVDVETTGLTHEDALTEIAALRVSHGHITGTFHTLINPQQAIPEVVTRITGIHEAMVADAPPVKIAIRDFIQWLTQQGTTNHPDPVFVAHNVPFDLGFIQRAAQKYEMTWPELRTIDTLELSRALLPKPRVAHHRLGTVASYLRIGEGQHHRALQDAHMTWHVLEKFIEMCSDKD
nr:3'-5' exonuclease [Schaalia sp. lx-260]